ncbi:uncharacterized protein LOC114741329 [Neltuma alba]|uniref:uncharacterized protein LOC114741329 n=1 Tax=Neltuma alba TaxID=207710 RepID=UPI0010A47C54|nr:uncharacterized protein LOC114741329 [Prosopis alba]
MNLLSWNCRGAASKSFPARLRDVLRGKQANLVILVETRVNGVKADRIMKKLGFNNWIRVEATGYAGGIWLLWNDDEVNIHYEFSTTQLLHVQVSMVNSNHSFWLSCIYAEPSCQLRIALWHDLTQISSSMSEPWLVISDFNAYLSNADKKGSDHLNVTSMRQFNDCIQQTQLIEVDYVGDRFTWERDILKERIDWAFTNDLWLQRYPLTKVHHLCKFGLDHRPLFIRNSPDRWERQQTPAFSCQAAWFLEEDFINVVDQCWKEGSWNEKIALFTHEAREWNKRRVGNIPAKKNSLMKRIEEVDKKRRRWDNQYLAQTEK